MTDFDRSGNFIRWDKADLGPSLGYVKVSNTPVTVAGPITVTIEEAANGLGLGPVHQLIGLHHG